MIDTQLATILTGAGACGVFCILFVCGLIYPRSVVEDLKKERDAERARANAHQERADAAVTAAQGTRDIMAALQAGIGISRAETRQPVTGRPAGSGSPDGGVSP